MEQSQISERSRGVALILGASIGVFGAHRFYTGKIATGILL
jgi:TM2 domain-containing membrane protein YozV